MNLPPEQDSMESHIPVLEMISQNLAKHPVWSIQLLDALSAQLVIPLLRKERDSAPNLAAAIDAGFKLAHRDPYAVQDWVTLAHLLAKAERLSESLGWINRALEVQPEVSEYHRLRASVLERLGRYKEAYGAARMARSLNKDNADIRKDVKRIIRKLVISCIHISWALRNASSRAR